MEERPAKRLRDNGPEVELSRSEEDKTDTEDGDLQKETAPVTELLVSSEPSTSQINLLNLQVRTELHAVQTSQTLKLAFLRNLVLEKIKWIIDMNSS